MPDTKKIKIPGGWPPNEEEWGMSESDLRDWLEKIEGKLDRCLEVQGQHAVQFENHTMRIGKIEEEKKEFSIFRSGAVMAAIGAAFGAAASFVGKKSGLW